MRIFTFAQKLQRIMSSGEQIRIGQHEWMRNRQPGDRICLRQLNVTACCGLDCWERRKAQPLKVSISASLKDPFQSAADTDVVDDSTIHYGKLSKNILSRLDIQTEWLSSHGLAEVLEHVVKRTAGREDLIDALELDISYPKASMLGEEAGYILSIAYTEPNEVSSVLYIKNLRIPTLIGVNAHERMKKQMVVVNIWIDSLAPEASDGYVAVETLLTDSVCNSSFDTLEALATKVAADLLKDFVEPNTPGAAIRLRVEKPVAVPLAESPMIEIYRRSKPSDNDD